MTASAWPSLNTNAWLRLGCCNDEHPTRVEDVIEDDIVIAAPQAPHLEPVSTESVAEGCFLGWVMERGALEVPIKLVAHKTKTIPMWRVRSIGPPVETQRRRFVRVDTACAAVLYLLEGGAPTHIKTLTLSEGGISCELDRWAIDPGNRRFSVEIEVDGQVHAMTANTVWWGRMNYDERRSVGIEFHDVAPSTASHIRSFVFARQLDQRRYKQ